MGVYNMKLENENKGKIIKILEDSNRTLDDIDISISKKKDIDDSLNVIANEVGKIRHKLNIMKKGIDEGKESIQRNRKDLKDMLITFNLDYIIPIRDILVANLPDEISTEEDIRYFNVKENTMFDKSIQEIIENTDDLKNIIFLFEARYNDKGKYKGKEYVCIGKITIHNEDIEKESYSVSININEEEKKIKSEYKNVTINVENKLRIYNIISRLNNILHYGS